MIRTPKIYNQVVSFLKFNPVVRQIRRQVSIRTVFLAQNPVLVVTERSSLQKESAFGNIRHAQLFQDTERFQNQTLFGQSALALI